jgi:L-cysteine S-thiosulfotransferase
MIRASRLRAPITCLTVLMLAGASRATGPVKDPRVSTYAHMSTALKAMQDDDTANPAMLWVLDGEALWSAPAPGAGTRKSCQSCHGPLENAMKGVARRYPRFDASRAHAVSLSTQINICRTERMKAPRLAYESKPMLSLQAAIALQSRGLSIAPAEPALAAVVRLGQEIYHRRQGQLNLACSHCHDDNAGKRLAGSFIPQAHPTAYPLYRLEWQTLGSLERRFRNCMIGMRAEPYDYGSAEFAALAAFLRHRARGMTLESPGVRP